MNVPSKKRPSPYGSVKFKSVEEYHAAHPHEIQVILKELHSAIQQILPDAIELISYNMPAFKMKEILIYYAVNKNHIGLYPTPGPIIALQDELADFKTSKGAIQFPIHQALPIALIQKIVRIRLQQYFEKIEK